MTDATRIPPEHVQLAAQCAEVLQQLMAANPLVAPHARASFEVIDTLGEGGMGEVWRVRDRRLGREAALKILKPAGPGSSIGDGENLRRRFLREARVTARLDHPAVPPVFEAGLTPEGELYLLMKLIRGRTLRELIEAEEGPPDAVERRARLQILRKLCEAVDYAHSRGVVHRDIKPDNVMIGDYGEVYLMDWGLARVLDEPDDPGLSRAGSDSEALSSTGDLTAVGSFLGTPGYAAPEQIEGGADGQVDERADVFALGALLTELTTNHRAITGDTARDRVAQAASGLSRTPRDILPGLPRDLDEVAAQALEPDREERTPSAELFGRQLDALIAGEPVPAVEPTLGERLIQPLRRHPGWFAATSIGTVALLIGTATFVGLELDRRRAAAQSAAEQARAEAAAESAERARRVLASFNEAAALIQRGAPGGRIRARVDDAVEAAGRSVEALTRGGELLVEAGETAAARSLLTEASRDHPPAFAALYLLHRIELQERMRASSGDGASSATARRMTDALNQILTRADESGERNAFSIFAEAAKAQASGQSDRTEALFTEIIDHYSTRMPEVYYNRAACRRRRRDYAGAIEDLTEAIRIDPGFGAAYTNRGSLRLLLKRPGAEFDLSRALELDPKDANAWRNRGSLRVADGRLEAAVADYTEAIRLQPGRADSLGMRASVLVRLKRDEEAFEDYRRAFRIAPSHAGRLTEFIRLLLRLGRAEEGERLLRELRERSAPSADIELCLGGVYEKLHRLNEAEAAFDRAVRMAPRQARMHQARGEFMRRIGRHDEAFAAYAKAAGLAPDNADMQYNFALACSEMGRFEEGLRAIGAALRLRSRHSYSWSVRGVLNKNLGRLAEARSDYDKALGLDPGNTTALCNRGNLLAAMGQFSDAILDYSELLRRLPKNAEAYGYRALARFKAGDSKGALADFRKALELDPNHPQRAGIERAIKDLSSR